MCSDFYYEEEMKGFSLILLLLHFTSVHLDIMLISRSSHLQFRSFLHPLSPFSYHASRTQRGSSDSHSSEELPTKGDYRGLRRCSSGSEEAAQELFEDGAHSRLDTSSLEQLSPARCTGTAVRMWWYNFSDTL